jgi:hypothetical protein
MKIALAAVLLAGSCCLTTNAGEFAGADSAKAGKSGGKKADDKKGKKKGSKKGKKDKKGKGKDGDKKSAVTTP